MLVPGIFEIPWCFSTKKINAVFLQPVCEPSFLGVRRSIFLFLYLSNADFTPSHAVWDKFAQLVYLSAYMIRSLYIQLELY